MSVGKCGRARNLKQSRPIADIDSWPHTTKRHGLGVGLATCRSFITSHGGQLWIEKNEPNGAVFIFYDTNCRTTCCRDTQS
ncbi:hypothetical protein F7R04_26600 [Agrobacterium radiobacter]|nr:hypothetical protein F7R04_26600 [Agrobacterium tumefaciens]